MSVCEDTSSNEIVDHAESTPRSSPRRHEGGTKATKKGGGFRRRAFARRRTYWPWLLHRHTVTPTLLSCLFAPPLCLSRGCGIRCRDGAPRGAACENLPRSQTAGQGTWARNMGLRLIPYPSSPALVACPFLIPRFPVKAGSGVLCSCTVTPTPRHSVILSISYPPSAYEVPNGASPCGGCCPSARPVGYLPKRRISLRINAMNS